MSKPPHPGSGVDGGPSQAVGPKATAKELAVKVLPFVIGALLLGGLIAAHLLLGLRPQH